MSQDMLQIDRASKLHGNDHEGLTKMRLQINNKIMPNYLFTFRQYQWPAILSETI